MVIELPDVLAAWRQETLSRIPYVGDVWDDPACTDLLTHLTAGSPDELRLAVRDLGVARHVQRFSLPESLVDLASLVAVLAQPVATRLDSVDMASELADAWTEDIRRCSPGLVDPLSHLPTLAYLRLRVAEMYERSPSGDSAVHGCTLLILYVTDQRSLVARLATCIRVGREVDRMFSGMPRAMENGLAAVVVPADVGLAEAVATFQDNIHVTVRPLPLPADYDVFAAIFDGVVGEYLEPAP